MHIFVHDFFTDCCGRHRMSMKQVRELSDAKLSKAVEIETSSYPADEAASAENMRFRRENAGAFFLEGTLASVSV